MDKTAPPPGATTSPPIGTSGKPESRSFTIGVMGADSAKSAVSADSDCPERRWLTRKPTRPTSTATVASTITFKKENPRAWGLG